nr:hypothetical protein Iba_chr04dCG12180 [Ipomoea batatas]
MAQTIHGMSPRLCRRLHCDRNDRNRVRCSESLAAAGSFGQQGSRTLPTPALNGHWFLPGEGWEADHRVDRLQDEDVNVLFQELVRAVMVRSEPSLVLETSAINARRFRRIASSLNSETDQPSEVGPSRKGLSSASVSIGTWIEQLGASVEEVTNSGFNPMLVMFVTISITGYASYSFSRANDTIHKSSMSLHARIRTVRAYRRMHVYCPRAAGEKNERLLRSIICLSSILVLHSTIVNMKPATASVYYDREMLCDC